MILYLQSQASTTSTTCICWSVIVFIIYIFFLNDYYCIHNINIVFTNTKLIYYTKNRVHTQIFNVGTLPLGNWVIKGPLISLDAKNQPYERARIQLVPMKFNSEHVGTRLFKGEGNI